MNLQSIVSIYGGGPGSGCNPEVGKCGRPAGSGSSEEKPASRSFTLNNGRKIEISYDKEKQREQLAQVRNEEMSKLDPQVQSALKANKDTESIYKINGEWSPEREEMHQGIIDDYLKGHTPQENPRMIIVAGGTASGKTDAAGDAKQELGNSLYLNTDDIRARLPESPAFVGGNNQGLLQEEAGYIRDRVFDAATSQHYNMVLDAPGSKGVVALAQSAEQSGYKVAVYYVHRDVETAQTNASARPFFTKHLADLREVPPEVTAGSHTKSRGALTDLSSGREFKVYDKEGAARGHKGSIAFYRDENGIIKVYNIGAVRRIANGQSNKVPTIPNKTFTGFKKG